MKLWQFVFATFFIPLALYFAPLDPILVSKKQSADLLGLSLRSITNLISAKQLKARRVGRRTLISYRELLRFAQRDHKTPKVTSEEKPPQQ